MAWRMVQLRDWTQSPWAGTVDLGSVCHTYTVCTYLLNLHYKLLKKPSTASCITTRQCWVSSKVCNVGSIGKCIRYMYDAQTPHLRHPPQANGLAHGPIEGLNPVPLGRNCWVDGSKARACARLLQAGFEPGPTLQLQLSTASCITTTWWWYSWQRWVSSNVWPQVRNPPTG